LHAGWLLAQRRWAACFSASARAFSFEISIAALDASFIADSLPVVTAAAELPKTGETSGFVKVPVTFRFTLIISDGLKAMPKAAA